MMGSRSLVRKILGWTVVALFALVLVAGGLFVYYVHPDDSRIAGPFAPERGPLARRTERAGSLLANAMPHVVDMDQEAYGDAMATLTDQAESYASFGSQRFVSPYQVYYPVGTYPDRLEARDGLYVPAGRTLIIEPGLEGVLEIQFSMFAPRGAAKVLVRAGEGPEPVASVAHAGGREAKPLSTFDRQIGRYLDVDRSDRADKWESVQASISLVKEAKVRLACESEGLGCIVSDVAFYRVAEDTKPNYLVVLIDTLRGDGPEGGHAPAIQQLAAESTVFQRALAPGNMTSPSTNALLSCVRPSQLGSLAFSYSVAREKREEFYRRRKQSFPAQFARAGYDTAMIGNVSVISEAYGVGVDHGTVEQIAIETEAYETPQTTREAIRWLSRHGERPFFLYVHYNGPHAPYRAPLKDIRSVFPGFSKIRSYPDVLLTLYQSEVHYTDRYLGELLRSLETLGLKERTTVVLTADHGDQHELRPFRGNVAAPDFDGAYFDHGATLLNDEIRVPLMVRQPGGAPRLIDDLVSTIDVGPTLLDIAGLPGREDCSGASLAPYLRSAASAAMPPRVLGSEGFKGRAIVFDNRYKYIRTYEPTDKRVYSRESWSGPKRLYAVPEQVFDLTADPGERRDLSVQDRSLLMRARGLYRDFFAIKDAYELVIDNPLGQVVEAVFPKGEDVTLAEGVGELEPDAAALRFEGRESRRFVFKLAARDGQGPAVPRIEVDALPVPVRYTSMRLPIQIGGAALPLEAGGAGNLPELARVPEAFLRRVEDDGQSDRRIVAGNPEFEQVLREWGYLNDR